MTNRENQRLSSQSFPFVLRVAGLWVIWGSWAHLAGWSLSAMGALHALGYMCALPFLIIPAFVFWRKTSAGTEVTRATMAKWLHRTRKSPVLIAWSLISVLILIGALSYAPTNYDGISYRLPRVLYWLQENRWHWIEGLDHRQNVSGLGHEWMFAPLMAFTRSDRAIFVINFIPFLLLPGLFFIAARGLGIRTRVAQWWMWVWPMAYGITLQAGSIGSDLLPLSLSLTALAFISYARRSCPYLCLFLAILAIAALTGAKATSIPLALPLGVYWLWVAASTISWQGMLKIAIPAMPVLVVSSALPLAIACTIHTGHWAGNPGNRHGAEVTNPVAGILGNSIQITSGLLQLPLTPPQLTINQLLENSVKNHVWYQWVSKHYPGYKLSNCAEIPIEEISSVGFAITFLLLLAMIFHLFDRKNYHISLSSLQWLVLTSALISFMAFMGKLGTGGAERLSLPYIPIGMLCALFGVKNYPKLRGPASSSLRILPALCILPGLFLNPNRPLFPSDTISELSLVPKPYKDRIRSVYGAYKHRANILSPLLDEMPPSASIGFAGSANHSALGLFKPYGGRRVLNLTRKNQDRVDWIVALPAMLEVRLNIPFEEWEANSGFEKVSEKDIISLASVGPETWHIYRRKPATIPPSN